MNECQPGGWIQVNASINGEQVRLLSMRIKHMAGMVDDWTETFRMLNAEYRREVIQQFATEGVWGGEKWVGLTRGTIKDRLRHGYGIGPILDRSGALKESLTGTGSDHVEVISPRMWLFGTSISYAIYHQSREKRKVLPRRPFLVITAQFRHFVVRKMHETIKLGAAL